MLGDRLADHLEQQVEVIGLPDDLEHMGLGADNFLDLEDVGRGQHTPDARACGAVAKGLEEPPVDELVPEDPSFLSSPPNYCSALMNASTS